MKIDYWIPIVIFIGLGVLFFFPEPETNFLAYLGTAIFFIIVVSYFVYLLAKKSKK